MTMNRQNVSHFIGLLGGLLGIIAAVGGGVAWVVAYFATREQLRVVDCYQYYGSESLSAQADQILLLPKYRELNLKASEAQIRHQSEPANATLLAEYKEAVRVQDEAYDNLKKAQERSRNAIEEQKECGYQRPG